VEIGAGRRFYWSLRRELWESRSLYLAPLAVALLILLGSLIGAFRLPEEMRAAVTPGRFLSSPGLAVAVAFLAGTVRRRRQRGPV